MSQPSWTTNSGYLGTFPTGLPLVVQLNAFPIFPATFVQYKLLSGAFPVGISINQFGTLIGTPINTSTVQEYNFTIRATDDLNNIRDRSFSISISGAENKPKLTTLSGTILHVVDSVYVSYQLNYTNPSPTNIITTIISSGNLPPGLFITDKGLIKGYPEKPILGDRSPTIKTYMFSVQLSSDLGNDTVVYSIEVRNEELNGLPNTRVPVILNKKPKVEPILLDDPYYDYYVLNNRILPTIKANEYFSFKILGEDFDNNDFIYQYGDLPKGLVGNSTTGWIIGKPLLDRKGVFSYTISVSVAKKVKPSIVSKKETFTLTIKNEVDEDIVWKTKSDLGTILNGTISMLHVEATSVHTLNYRVTSGSLPNNLILQSNGEITGRVAEQPGTIRVLPEGTDTLFTFTVESFSPEYPLLHSFRTFTINVNQYYPKPLENIYLKALPDLAGKRTIQSLLTDKTLIPDEYIFRADDMFFGKAKDVSFVHVYGMESSTLETYIDAVQKNHYRRKIILGPIETAVATDEHGNILYEVVYSKIIDDLESANGDKLPDKLHWYKDINLRQGSFVTNTTQYTISNGSIKANQSPGSVRVLYPAGLQNMRSSITSAIKQNFDSRLLPKWMVTQQTNSETLGFIQAWVICYTKPNKSTVIKDLINNNWSHKLNEIDFTIDRLMVDKSATYNWNTKLSVPAWNDLPSATPVPDPLDLYDVVVLFPRKTILPNA
jgi:hypothetical protein